MSVSLSATYLGLALRNPLVVSACPLTGDVSVLQRLEQAGAAAAVLPSLFEEQIEHEEFDLYHLYERQSETFSESLSYFPELEHYNTGPDSYLKLIEQAKQHVRMPIIASLNGVSTGGWVRYAKLIESAGADAIELNVCFVPTDPLQSSIDVEDQLVTLVSAVRERLTIPLAVKIGPFFSSLPHLAARIEAAGADGLVLFNRFLEPDIDIETLHVEPQLVLSTPHELRLPLRWIAILRGQVSLSLAATSGVHTTADVIKALLAGADVVEMAATLLRQGAEYVSRLERELAEWLAAHEYESVAQLRGSLSLNHCPDPSALQRANYMKALVSFTDW